MNIVIAIWLVLAVMVTLILIPAMMLSSKISREEECRRRLKEKEVQEDGNND